MDLRSRAERSARDRNWYALRFQGNDSVMLRRIAYSAHRRMLQHGLATALPTFAERANSEDVL